MFQPLVYGRKNIPPHILDRAHRYCRLAALVYENWAPGPELDAVKAAADALGYPVTETIDHNDSQAMVVANRMEAVVVFRGTEATKGRIRDVVSNFSPWPVKWQGDGCVHAGYLRYLNMIDGRVDDILAPYRAGSGCEITVVGHSLGGAVATLFAAEHSDYVNRLCTIAAPKALTSGSRRNMWSMEILKVRDPVDFAPYWQPGLLGRHPEGRTIWCKNDRHIRPLTRHSVDRYVAAIGGQ
jgi:pimeloyl-ACP methyl ester carboxylesterase